MHKVVVAALCILLSIVISAQEKDWKRELEAKLETLYPLTKMDNAFFAGRTALKETGIVLIVQQAGIPATDGAGLLARISRVQDGKVMNPQGRTGPGAHICKVGEEVYLRDVNVDDDQLTFRLVTVEPIESTKDGTTRAQRHFAFVRFEFEKGFLSAASIEDIEKAISPGTRHAITSHSVKDRGAWPNDYGSRGHIRKARDRRETRQQSYL